VIKERDALLSKGIRDANVDIAILEAKVKQRTEELEKHLAEAWEEAAREHEEVVAVRAELQATVDSQETWRVRALKAERERDEARGQARTWEATVEAHRVVIGDLEGVVEQVRTWRQIWTEPLAPKLGLEGHKGCKMVDEWWESRCQHIDAILDAKGCPDCGPDDPDLCEVCVSCGNDAGRCPKDDRIADLERQLAEAREEEAHTAHNLEKENALRKRIQAERDEEREDIERLTKKLDAQVAQAQEEAAEEYEEVVALRDRLATISRELRAWAKTWELSREGKAVLRAVLLDKASPSEKPRPCRTCTHYVFVEDKANPNGCVTSCRAGHKKRVDGHCPDWKDLNGKS
jgi:hypothetical protein